MELLTLFVWFVGAIFCGAIGGAIGAAKGKGGFGFFLGFIFGPIGILIVAVLPNDKRRDFLSDAMAPASAQQAPARLQDATSALLDLKKLLDAGAITQAEFDSKKKVLLEKIGSVRRPAAEPSAVRYGD